MATRARMSVLGLGGSLLSLCCRCSRCYPGASVPAGTPNAKEWVTGQAMYGELKGGYVFKCSLGLAQRCVSDCACRCKVQTACAMHTV